MVVGFYFNFYGIKFWMDSEFIIDYFLVYFYFFVKGGIVMVLKML